MTSKLHFNVFSSSQTGFLPFIYRVCYINPSEIDWVRVDVKRGTKHGIEPCGERAGRRTLLEQAASCIVGERDLILSGGQSNDVRASVSTLPSEDVGPR